MEAPARVFAWDKSQGMLQVVDGSFLDMVTMKSNIEDLTSMSSTTTIINIIDLLYISQNG